MASQPKMELANPFQIYFLVWGGVFFGLLAFRSDFIEPPWEFWYLLTTTHASVFVLLIIVFLNKKKWVERIGQINLSRLSLNGKLVFSAQLIVFFALPLVYVRAVDMASGNNIFSVAGYVQLRTAMTVDGDGFGFLAYLFSLAFIITSLQVCLYVNKKIKIYQLAASLLISLTYAYLTTGRTFGLLFVTLVLFPLIIFNVVRIRGVLISACIVALIFLFVAVMTEKNTNENSLFGYTLAPILAFSNLVTSDVPIDFGKNTFRLFYAVSYAFGFTDSPPIALIKSYEFVPMPTNVFTVYEPYFRDFSYIGLFIPTLFMVGHWFLYVKARKSGGVWVFYYAASVYPLMMQFFQDQYFSLLSSWIQIVFWYWLFVDAKNKKLV